MKTPVNYKRSLPTSPRDKVVADVIGVELRSYYGRIESQDIPPQLLDLLEQLDKKTEPAKN